MPDVLIIPDFNNIEGSLQLASEYNSAFEFNDFFLPDLLDNKNKISEMIIKYKHYGIPDKSTMHGAFLDVTVFSSDRKIRDVSDLRVCQSIETALELGVRAVIFHTNYIPTLLADSYYDNWIDANDKYWREKINQYKNIDIFIENMFDITPEPLKKLAERMKDCNNFGVCLDYAHASLSDYPIENWVQVLGPYIRHMHINDNDLKKDLHLQLGTGKIDWTIFTELYRKYVGNASILIEHTNIEKQKKSLDFFINMFKKSRIV